MFERVLEVIGDERRNALDRQDSNALRSSIREALAALRLLSAVQTQWDGAVAIDPVDKLLVEVGDAVLALRDQGQDVPLIDLCGVCEAFTGAMPAHPVLDQIGRMLEQQEQKAKLLAKWGNRPEWIQRRNAIGCERRQLASPNPQ